MFTSGVTSAEEPKRGSNGCVKPPLCPANPDGEHIDDEPIFRSREDTANCLLYLFIRSPVLCNRAWGTTCSDSS